MHFYGISTPIDVECTQCVSQPYSKFNTLFSYFILCTPNIRTYVSTFFARFVSFCISLEDKRRVINYRRKHNSTVDKPHLENHFCKYFSFNSIKLWIHNLSTSGESYGRLAVRQNRD